jgi:phosphatidate cytidylyltransferase
MFRVRLITALILIAAFLGALFLLPEVYWAALMLAVACVGAWEWSALAGFTLPARRAYVALTLLAGICLLPLPWPATALVWQQQIQLWTIFAAAVFWLLLAPVWLLKQYAPNNAAVMACAGWLVLMPTWLALDDLRRVSPLLVLALMATVWIADSAAYFAGKRFGRHKLAPQISPGKTWEGVLGALAAVTLYGAVLCRMFHLSWWTLVGLWALTMLSIVGDLFESLLKRHAGVKDSGALLPGHGGVLDRIDGLTSTLPLAAFYAYFPLYYAALWDGQA